MMLNTEVLWNKALTENNLKGLVGCLWGLSYEGEGDPSERLACFNVWLQRSADLARKELVMLCFSRCQGLWMFLDEDSVALVHKLVLKMKNLLSLIRLIKKHSKLLHGKQESCASYMWSCWAEERQAIRRHVLLGVLVQWWSSTGLLPKHPEAREMKRISQMWRQMGQKHRRTCLEFSCSEEKHCWSSLIQGMVAHLDNQHGPVWVSEDGAYQTYPPPSLEALLKLMLLLHVDIMSVQAIMMYFVLDVTNFLRCKDDLLLSFCRVFSIPSTFSQQICGFWLLDHGFVMDSMDVLLSPRARPPALSCHHCTVLRTCLRTGEDRAALKYLKSITPAVENTHDIKLHLDVLIQNKSFCEAWALLRGIQTQDVHLFRHFIHGCERHGIDRLMLATLCEDMAHLHLKESQNIQSNDEQTMNHETTGQPPEQTELAPPPRPLSSRLPHTDDSLTSEDFVRMLRQSIYEISPQPKTRRVLILLPEYSEKSENNPGPPLLSFCHDTNILYETKKETVEEECDEDLHLHTEEEPVFSSPSTSPDSMESVGFFTSTGSSPSPAHSETAQEPIHLKHISEDKTLADVTAAGPDVTLTDGTAESLTVNRLSRESDVKDKVLSSVGPRDTIHSSERDTKETHAKRLLSSLNLHPHCYSNEDNQSVDSIPDFPSHSQNFSSANHDKFTYHKMVDDGVNMKPGNLTEAEAWLISETQYDRLEDPETVGTSGTSCFLELKPLKRAFSPSRMEDSQEGFCQDSQDQPEILTSCAFRDATDLSHHTSSSRVLQTSVPDTDLSLLHLSQHPIWPVVIRPCSSSQSQVSSCCEGPGHCKLGSWWKQTLETRRASTGLLPALQQLLPVTQASSTSPGPQSSQTPGLGSFSSNARVDKRELKQAVKSELTGRRGSFTVTDHGSSSYHGRRGKTSKRIKRA